MAHPAQSQYPVTINRRSTSRATLRMELQFTMPDGTAHAGASRDICVGGMFIESAYQPPIGGTVTVLCTLPGSATPLLLPALVRWARPDGFGVQFDLLGARETHALAALMTRLRTRG